MSLAMDRGERSEQFVIQYLQEKSWHLLFHRKKFFQIEVDLVFARADQILILEVKTLSSIDFLEHRINSKQKRRLEFAASLVGGKFPKCEFTLAYAYVIAMKDILFFSSLGDPLGF